MPTKTQPETLAEFRELILADLADRKVTRGSIRNAERVLDDLERLRIRELSTLERTDTEKRFIDGLGDRCKKLGSLKTWRKAYRAIVRRGGKLRWLKAPPFEPLGPEDRGTTDGAMPPADGVALLKDLRAARETLEGGRFYLLMDLAILCGVKPMSSLALRLIDVGADFDWVELQGRGGVRPKRVMLRPHQQAFLRDWVKQPRVQASGWLFPGKKKGRWSYHSWHTDRPSAWLERAWERLGRGPYTFPQVMRLYKIDQGRGMVALEPEILAEIAKTRAGPRIQLRAPSEPFTIDGDEYPAFSTRSYFDMVEYVLQAFPGGRTSKDMYGKFRNGWRTTLGRLLDARPEIGDVMQRPGPRVKGKKGGLFRISAAP
jgi:hypothetical protein